ncbi:MAG: DUF4157 domain-containing protein [Mucilaginibacter sp.]|nr:DUF4157 domain-containing protein [Mucilaginibacter sp.]
MASEFISNSVRGSDRAGQNEKGTHFQEDVLPGITTQLNTRQISPKLTVGVPNDPLEHEADAVADRVTQAPQSNFFQRKCADCEKEEKLNRKSEAPAAANSVSSSGVVASADISQQIESNRSGGAEMDRQTKGFMESRFGTDFSDVRIHNNEDSKLLSRSLNAQAFTVGKDIYFNEDRYDPKSASGKWLLAHELTHTIQQKGGVNAKLIQRVCHEDGNPSITVSSCPEGSADVGRQAQGVANGLDAKADAIIATATGSGDNSTKAMQVVNDMLCSYMPGQISKVRKINYFASEPGLATQSVGSGASARGDICVGDYFLTGTTRGSISRRLLQLAHELEHIDQYRSGLAGANNKTEREFLAFYHESLADEFTGTGRMSHSTRKGLIDGALGQYNCLSAALKTTHQSKQQDLLTRRQTVNGTNGNPSTQPPQGCASGG